MRHKLDQENSKIEIRKVKIPQLYDPSKARVLKWGPINDLLKHGVNFLSYFHEIFFECQGNQGIQKTTQNGKKSFFTVNLQFYCHAMFPLNFQWRSMQESPAHGE